MYLRIAGFTIRVASADADLDLTLSPATARFAIDPPPPDLPIDVQIDVAVRHLTDDHAGEPLFDSGGTWQLFRLADGFLFRCSSPAFGPSPYKIARWNRDFTRGEICLNQRYFAPKTPVDPLEYPLDELLVIHLLGQGRGLEVHGCGVIDAAGEAYLMVGQSGAGKTTMARLWLGEPGSIILSDDRIVLRAESDGIWMYGTPWHGDEPLASPRGARLARVFFLAHGSSHSMMPVSNVDAAARLFAASFPPFHDASAIDFSLRFIETVVKSVPCRVLAFAPEPSAIEFLRCSVLGH